LQISERTTSLAGIREVRLGTSLSAVNLNHRGSIEGIPPDRALTCLRTLAVPGQ
jgi:hypothetical protein